MYTDSEGLVLPNFIVHRPCQYIIYYYIGMVYNWQDLSATNAMTLDGFKINQTEPMRCEACNKIITHPDDVIFVSNNEKDKAHYLLNTHYIKAFDPPMLAPEVRKLLMGLD